MDMLQNHVQLWRDIGADEYTSILDVNDIVYNIHPKLFGYTRAHICL